MMDGSACMVCVNAAGCCFWMLAAVEDEEKVKGFNAIFSLLVLFLSPLTFSRGVLRSHGFHESFGGRSRKSWGDIVRTTHRPHE